MPRDTEDVVRETMPRAWLTAKSRPDHARGALRAALSDQGVTGEPTGVDEEER